MLFWKDTHRKVYNKSCLDMSELPDNSVHCCVTSPPYWGLQKYAGAQDLVWGGDNHHEHEWIEGVIQGETWEAGKALSHGGSVQKNRQDNPEQWNKVNHKYGFCRLCGAWRGQLGLEPTPELYIEHLVQIFREVKRVLRPDGVFWVNIGDSYAGSNKGRGDYFGPNGKQETVRGASGLPVQTWGNLKAKDLVLIPERLAIALQQDGWWVRSRIAWIKPNPMPESVLDRPTDSWEHIWMLTKSARYYFDMEAVREPAQYGYCEGFRSNRYVNNRAFDNSDTSADHCGAHTPTGNGGRNLRSAWTFPTEPFKGAHFATFPSELPRRCIKASTSEKGCCPKCGKPWVRVIEISRTYQSGSGKAGHKAQGKWDDAQCDGDLEDDIRSGPCVSSKTLGWRPGCDCGIETTVPCVVLDPFAGSGTTLKVAAELGRHSVGYELSEEYCRLIVDRNKQAVLSVQ